MPVFTSQANQPGWRLIRAPITYLLIGASIVVAFATNLGMNREADSWLTIADLHDPDRTILGGFSAVLHGQLWRLVSPILLHFGFIHIFFNMMWLKDLGCAIENRWGSWAFLRLVLVSAVISNLAQYLINWDFVHGLSLGNPLSGGMSGVLYALLGYIWIRGRYDRTATFQLHHTTALLMAGWLVFCCTGALGYVGNSAHLSGLLVGLGWGWLATMRANREA